MPLRPWFDTLRPYGIAWPGEETVASLREIWPEESGPLSGLGMPLRVTESGADQGAVAYELGIANSGQLPTRNNAHDWFNALMWLAYPQTKRALNRLQAEQAEQVSAGLTNSASGKGLTRTRIRDALTVLDENGAVFVTPCAEKVEALSQFRWRELFVRGRTDWVSTTSIFLIGHALLEKLEHPHLGVCAHAAVWLMPEIEWKQFCELGSSQRRARVDAWLACWLLEHLTTPQVLQPLPVLGVPGWWAANEDECFYNNTVVFRAGRSVRPRSK
jgi:hypothetical protein